jgi:hypothetical protein
MSMDNILIYEGFFCAYISWEIVLDVGIDASVDNTENRKGMQHRVREVSSADDK